MEIKNFIKKHKKGLIIGACVVTAFVGGAAVGKKMKLKGTEDYTFHPYDKEIKIGDTHKWIGVSRTYVPNDNPSISGISVGFESDVSDLGEIGNKIIEMTGCSANNMLRVGGVITKNEESMEYLNPQIYIG